MVYDHGFLERNRAVDKKRAFINRSKSRVAARALPIAAHRAFIDIQRLRAFRLGQPGDIAHFHAAFAERLRLIDADTLADPVALVGPWQMTLKYVRQKGANRMLEYNCTENDRNPVVDGKMSIRSP